MVKPVLQKILEALKKVFRRLRFFWLATLKKKKMLEEEAGKEQQKKTNHFRVLNLKANIQNLCPVKKLLLKVHNIIDSEAGNDQDQDHNHNHKRDVPILEDNILLLPLLLLPDKDLLSIFIQLICQKNSRTP